jgi:hypothetical protein
VTRRSPSPDFKSRILHSMGGAQRGGTIPARRKAMNPEQKRIQDLEISGPMREAGESVSLIETLDEWYPQAKMCRVSGVNQLLAPRICWRLASP